VNIRGSKRINTGGTAVVFTALASASSCEFKQLHGMRAKYRTIKLLNASDGARQNFESKCHRPDVKGRTSPQKRFQIKSDTRV